jgi:hypothetical protein
MQTSTLWKWGPFWKRTMAARKKPKSKSQKVMEALVLTLLLAYLLLLSFPQMVFARSVTYHNFRVYSTAPLDGSITPALDKAEKRLAASEVNDPRASYHIFLCPSHAAFAFFDPSARSAFGNNLSFVHNIFVNTADVRADEVTTGTGQHDRRSLSGVIAHECTHTLLAERFGQVRILLTPHWKQEGYCDYVAQATSFDREEGTKLLRQGGSDSSPSFFYFKASTAITYLKDRRHWSVSRIMDTPLRLDEVVREAVFTHEEKSNKK